ncbi:MAG: glycoside hydrolase family 130 protein [Anaerolineae bacterium]
MFQRHPRNPLITPADVSPSRPDFEVIGAFNAGVAIHQNEVLLLLRVAERPLRNGADSVHYPVLQEDGNLTIHSVSRHDNDYDTSDPRLIKHLKTGETYLSSISHLRLARSSDGINFTVDRSPWLHAQPPYENFGVEDARITLIDDTYYVNYSAVSSLGISTGLVATSDFQQSMRHGVIFPPANRDVVIFPEQINGEFLCYHRPMPSIVGNLNMWFASSPDLRHWGGHRVVLQSQTDGWEAGRVGGGAPPIKTAEGWLSIYHAADRNDCYCLGAFLTPLEEPWRVIKRSQRPILAPTAIYETEGFFRNVVFSCGAILKDDRLQIYYGACDQVIALAEASLQDVLASMTEVESAKMS